MYLSSTCYLHLEVPSPSTVLFVVAYVPVSGSLSLFVFTAGIICSRASSYVRLRVIWLSPPSLLLYMRVLTCHYHLSGYSRPCRLALQIHLRRLHLVLRTDGEDKAVPTVRLRRDDTWVIGWLSNVRQQKALGDRDPVWHSLCMLRCHGRLVLNNLIVAQVVSPHEG